MDDVQSSESQGGALVLEENDSLRTMISDALRHFGFTPLEARNGTEALAIGRSAPNVIRLLVADLGLPGMDAQTTAAFLRLLQPHAKVLCLSSTKETALSYDGRNECDAVLRKPFGLNELRASITKVLE